MSRQVATEVAVATDPTCEDSGNLPSVAAQIDLVRRIAFSLARNLPGHIEIDELVSLGNLGLVEASVRFDPSRGVPFAAFAASRIRGAMLDGLRQVDPLSRDERARVKRNETEASVVLVDYGSVRESASHDRPVDEAMEERQSMAQIEQALGHLTDRQRHVIVRHFLDGFSLKMIGEELGVTESRVCQVVSETVAELRRFFEVRQSGRTPRKRRNYTARRGRPSSENFSVANVIPLMRRSNLSVPPIESDKSALKVG